MKKKPTKPFQWAIYEKEFFLDQTPFQFKPLHSGQIAAVIRFLKENQPQIPNQYLAPYLRPAFYQKQVAIIDRWKRTSHHQIFLGVVESAKKIVGVIAAECEPSALPVITSQIGVVDQAHWNNRLFAKMLQCMIAVAKGSGIKSGWCLASAKTAAAQRAYLDAGLTLCGVDPLAEIMEVSPGEWRYLPDLFFYGFINEGEMCSLPESQWDLVPEAAELWQKIKDLRGRQKKILK